LALVFIAIAEAVSLVDIETIHPVFKEAIEKIIIVFASGPVAFLVAWIRNNSGYFEALARQHVKDVPAKYNLNRYWSTIARYMGIVAAAFILLPEPYNYIGVAVGYFIDLIGTELYKVFGKKK